MFRELLPETTRLYFGLDLEPQQFEERAFLLASHGLRQLAVVHRPQLIGAEEFSELVRHIVSMGALAGLVVSESACMHLNAYFAEGFTFDIP